MISLDEKKVYKEDINQGMLSAPTTQSQLVSEMISHIQKEAMAIKQKRKCSPMKIIVDPVAINQSYNADMESYQSALYNKQLANKTKMSIANIRNEVRKN